MAATFSPADALDFAKSMLKRMPLETIEAQLLDQVHKMIWMAAPWRWTIGTFSGGTLLSNTQDYTITPPEDFLYLLDGYLSDGQHAPRYLKADSVLPSNDIIVGQPSRYALNDTTLRLFPKPGTVNVSPATTITAYYKKMAPTITEQNKTDSGLLVMDDEWFWVYAEGVLWKSYQYGDDQRGGNVQFDSAKGAWASTGQRAIFEAAIETMRQREKLPIFDPRPIPDPVATRG